MLIDQWLSVRELPYSPNRLEVRIVTEEGAKNLPFPVRFTNGKWCNASTGETVLEEIVAWRTWPTPKALAGIRPERKPTQKLGAQLHGVVSDIPNWKRRQIELGFRPPNHSPKTAFSSALSSAKTQAVKKGLLARSAPA